jgi:hypothetical protein
LNTSESALKTGLWIFLLTVAGVLTTFVLACATPVAAFAALAALYMRRNAAIALMVAVWAAGQVIGFGFLHYPHTAGTFAWTGALLICSLMTLEGGFFAARSRVTPLVRAVMIVLATMIVFKAAIYLFGTVLGGNGSAFNPVYVFKYIWTNALTFVVLLALHRIAVVTGLVARGVGRDRALA